VQIAGSTYPKYPETAAAIVRESQARCVSFLNNIFMTSAVDLGDPNSLHPRDKSVLSRRLTNVVMEKIFRQGKNNLCPAYFSHAVSENQVAIFTEFNHLNLVSRSRQNLGFQVSFDGDTFVDWDQITLTGSQILVRSVKKVKEIRYAFANNPRCDIFTANDLPLLPFRIRIE